MESGLSMLDWGETARHLVPAAGCLKPETVGDDVTVRRGDLKRPIQVRLGDPGVCVMVLVCGLCSCGKALCRDATPKGAL